MTKLLAVTILALTLAGCATAPHSAPITGAYPAAPTLTRHTVMQGQTLWSIAKSYGVDVDALVRANDIGSSGTITKGQILVIPRPSQAGKNVNFITRSGGKLFIWPVRGYVISQFGSKVDKTVNKGIDIKAREGTDVVAARSGRVVYCDSHLKGFGKTVIIDHMDSFQTVYSYNSDILVKVGEEVRQKDVIAKVGSSGRAKEPMLHFEIRKNGKPQNPGNYLPY